MSLIRLRNHRGYVIEISESSGSLQEQKSESRPEELMTDKSIDLKTSSENSRRGFSFYFPLPENLPGSMSKES